MAHTGIHAVALGPLQVCSPERYHKGDHPCFLAGFVAGLLSLLIVRSADWYYRHGFLHKQKPPFFGVRRSN